MYLMIFKSSFCTHFLFHENVIIEKGVAQFHWLYTVKVFVLFQWTNADSHGIHSNKLRGDSYLIRSRYRMWRKIQSPRGIRILCWHCHKSWNNRNPDRCWGCSHSRLHRHSWCRTLRYHHYRMNNHIAVRRWGYNYWRYYLWRDLLVAQLFFCYSPGHFENCCCFDFLRYFFHSHYDADFDW